MKKKKRNRMPQETPASKLRRERLERRMNELIEFILRQGNWQRAGKTSSRELEYNPRTKRPIIPAAICPPRHRFLATGNKDRLLTIGTLTCAVFARPRVGARWKFLRRELVKDMGDGNGLYRLEQAIDDYTLQNA